MATSELVTGIVISVLNLVVGIVQVIIAVWLEGHLRVLAHRVAQEGAAAR
ncbi:hypothetical protein BDV96DRAFT_651820 [Lophiotrema nucula]|uniref:Uncharacterized protein n=1 Tax=Lophiotrema nucula TaxID=690887 RepID=A0A6A5YQT7_9PLEO|nr:hypothetical protein BDV96DRAFT_651820 [Lophiotrema nucula]